MKRPLLIIGITLVGALLLPSCTKSLKDDVNYLEGQVDSLKKRNAALREQAKATQNILGADEPITATTTYKDANGVDKTYKDTYSFKSGNAYTQLMVRQTSGQYYVYIERFSDIDWYEGAWLEFLYDPTSKEISQKIGGQYWASPWGYKSTYYKGTDAGCQLNINLKSINTASGEISLDFTGTATAAYTANNTRWPAPGQAHATQFSFTGKLSVQQAGD